MAAPAAGLGAGPVARVVAAAAVAAARAVPARPPPRRPHQRRWPGGARRWRRRRRRACARCRPRRSSRSSTDERLCRGPVRRRCPLGVRGSRLGKGAGAMRARGRAGWGHWLPSCSWACLCWRLCLSGGGGGLARPLPVPPRRGRSLESSHVCMEQPSPWRQSASRQPRTSSPLRAQLPSPRAHSAAREPPTRGQGSSLRSDAAFFF